jgi:uncharacterized protein YecE (DUF72 family)
VDAYVGCSGFAYDFWKGSFYPEKLKSADMLAFYAQRFRTVEINNTFYRIPKSEVVQRWADTVPDDFRFVIKASRRITHNSKLADCQDTVEHMVRQLEPLGDKLGAVLFQCPPYLRKSVERLEGFLAMLPQGLRAVLEFRHDSWFSEDVYDQLRAAKVGLCIGDYEGKTSSVITGGRTPMVSTCDWGYVRLRDASYDEAALRDWSDTLQAQGWTCAYVFFKHEETAPALAQQLGQVLSAQT